MAENPAQKMVLEMDSVGIAGWSKLTQSQDAVDCHRLGRVFFHPWDPMFREDECSWEVALCVVRLQEAEAQNSCLRVRGAGVNR